MKTIVTTAKTMAADTTRRRTSMLALHAVSVDQSVRGNAPRAQQGRPGVGANLHVLHALVHGGEVLEGIEEDGRRVGVDRLHGAPPQRPSLFARGSRNRAVHESLEVRAVVARVIRSAEPGARPGLRDSRAGRGIVAARQNGRVELAGDRKSTRLNSS